MKWNYKCDTMLRKPVYGIIGLLQFLVNLSWLYAHYRNGSFPYQFPDTPRLTFKRWSFWTCVKNEWSNRHSEY